MGPRLRAYLEGLPDGLGSYPECRAKASLYRSVIEASPLDAAQVPEGLRDLLRRPRPVTDWIPEVHSHAILIAQCDQRFVDLPGFAKHCYDVQRALWASKIYAFMMRFVSPVRLLASTSQRWGQFHRGSELVSTRVGEDSAELRLIAPPRVYDEITMIGLTEGIRALLDCGSTPSELTLLERDATGGRWSVRWGGEPWPLTTFSGPTADRR